MKNYYAPENEHQRVDSFSLPPEAIDKSAKVLNVRQQTRRKFAHSLVGTSNYMAPEVIQKSGHTKSCDWWSMGVILYEMVFGRVPFYSENPAEIQHRILNWRHTLDLSPGVPLSRECLIICQQLICGVENRLGSKGGASQIKMHPWFNGIDWQNLRKSRAEFIPMVTHDEDTSNFDTIQ
uniref:non-specific serine/threonine protein kinase n=1 Tax=Caenorhabditis japonica TaxID=281687 RepID=A0A8R1IBP0_CAEJA